ncbi:MAG: hypothetical protein U1E56_09380 [Bauldia sp.]
MADAPVAEPKNLAEAIDTVEAAYEFMLAYAAQGRRTEDESGGSGVRDYLKRASAALAYIANVTSIDGSLSPSAGKPLNEFLDLVKADARKAATVINFALAQRSIGSQMADNMNATIHIRTLLTDLFLLDEALKISGL